MWRLALLALPALVGADWLAKAESALAAARPNAAPEKAPPAAATATAPNWLLGAREAATRRLDQTVDYDAQCLTAFGQCEADL